MSVTRLPCIAASLALCAAAAAQHSGAQWARHQIDNSLFGADGARPADANGDGLLDLAADWEQSGVSRVYINPGPCLSREEWPFVTVADVSNTEDAVLVDLDGDGAMDVVTSTEEGSRKVYISWAPTDPAQYMNAAAWVTDYFPLAPEAAWVLSVPMEVDGQNGVDLVIGSRQPDNPPYNTAFGWLKSPPGDKRDLASWIYYRQSSLFWTMNIIVCDMDYDGDDDVLVSDRHGAGQGVRWLENPGVGSPAQQQIWTSRPVANTGQQTMTIDRADIDMDGLPDLIVPVHPNKIYWHEALDQSGVKFEEHQVTYPTMVGQTKALKAADVDGDGLTDIVLSCSDADPPKSGVLWLRNPGNPLEPNWEVFEISGPEGVKFDRIEFIDLDGDGDADLITTEENDNGAGAALGLVWYENPFGLVAGDADRDGIVTFADLNLVLSLWQQKGEGLAGDLDGDGAVDFADLNIVLSAYNTGHGCG